MPLSKKQREELKAMFGGHCAYCGEPLGNKWHADHVEPVIRKLKFVDGEFRPAGGFHRPENDRPDNYMPSCISCNIHKSTHDVEGFRKMLEGHIQRLNTAQRFAYYRHAKRFGLVHETPKKVVFYFERAST